MAVGLTIFDDLVVVGDDFRVAVYHVGRLIKADFRNDKTFRAIFLVEKDVSTWRQVKFKQSSVVKGSCARAPRSFWVLGCWIVPRTYVAGAKSVMVIGILGSCDHKSCFDLLWRA